MHNRPPHAPYPPGSPPGGPPYNRYAQMQSMQPYSPCPPLPQPCYQPPPAATPMPGPMHPAYQQPPQLPGAYPRSPSRMNPHKAAHMQQWMDPHMCTYSPVPSIAPSVMSGMSGMYSDRSSVMSYSSIPFDMAMDCTPEMRSPSQISTISCSENIDPMQGQVPLPIPQSISPSTLPQFFPIWKTNFHNPQYQMEILRLISCLLTEMEKTFKKSKEEGELMRNQLSILVELVPRFIETMEMMNKKGIPSTKQHQLICNVFCAIVISFPEHQVGPYILCVKDAIVVIAEHLQKTGNVFICRAFEAILDWKGDIAKKARFRALIRPRLDFVKEVICQLRNPQNVVNNSVLFYLGILRNLAHNADQLKDQLAADGEKGLVKEGLVPVLFFEVYRMVTDRLHANPSTKSMFLKTCRCILTLIHTLLSEATEKKDATKVKMAYIRKAKVAFQLATTRALLMVCDFYKIVTNPDFRIKPGDFLITKTADILSNCGMLLQQGSTKNMDLSDPAEPYRIIFRENRGNILNELIPRLQYWVHYLVMNCCNEFGMEHRSIAQSLYQFTIFSPAAQEIFLFPTPRNPPSQPGLPLLFHWINQLVPMKSTLKEKWKTCSIHVLDTEDTLLCLFTALLKNPVNEMLFPAMYVSGLLKILFEQMLSMLMDENQFLMNPTIPHWEYHKNLFKHLICMITRMVNSLEVLQTHPILPEIFDNQNRENIISCFFRILKTIQSTFRSYLQGPLHKTGLTEIVIECFRTLISMWKVFDPVRNLIEPNMRIREMIKIQARLHIEQICVWIYDLNNDKRNLTRILEFFLLISVEEGPTWPENVQAGFRELCHSQDSEINSIGNQICSSFQAQPAANALFADVGQAMDIYI